jgi:hypothetical protein
MFRFARSALLSSSVILACGLLSAAAHADVYKYKDEKGNVLYTDKPMFLPAERISKTEASNVVDLDERNESEQSSQSERDTARRSAAEQKKSKETDTAGKAELCNKARKDYLDRMGAQRLYEDQPNGEKRFLSEKELLAARASAKQAMDALCN